MVHSDPHREPNQPNEVEPAVTPPAPPAFVPIQDAPWTEEDERDEEALDRMHERILRMAEGPPECPTVEYLAAIFSLWPRAWPKHMDTREQVETARWEYLYQIRKWLDNPWKLTIPGFLALLGDVVDALDSLEEDVAGDAGREPTDTRLMAFAESLSRSAVDGLPNVGRILVDLVTLRRVFQQAARDYPPL